MLRKILTDTREDNCTEIAWDDNGTALGDFEYTGYVLVEADGALRVAIGPDGLHFHMGADGIEIRNDDDSPVWTYYENA